MRVVEGGVVWVDGVNTVLGVCLPHRTMVDEVCVSFPAPGFCYLSNAHTPLLHDVHALSIT
jgi:hypothetical protein